MSLPPLLHLAGVAEYRNYYLRHYCRGVIMTFDNIRVYFAPQKFGHAFYENSNKGRGPKDVFSKSRAQRIGWIKATLESQDSELYMGWNKDDKSFDEARRVSVLYEDFIVVIEMGLSRKAGLKANFVTCYSADNSIERIRSSPRWDKDKCLKRLEK